MFTDLEVGQNMPEQHHFRVSSNTVRELWDASAQLLFEFPPLLAVATTEENEMRGVFDNIAAVAIRVRCVFVHLEKKLIEWQAIENDAHNDARLRAGQSRKEL